MGRRCDRCCAARPHRDRGFEQGTEGFRGGGVARTGNAPPRSAPALNIEACSSVSTPRMSATPDNDKKNQIDNSPLGDGLLNGCITKDRIARRIGSNLAKGVASSSLVVSTAHIDVQALAAIFASYVQARTWLTYTSPHRTSPHLTSP